MKHLYSGKVRDLYEMADGRLLFVASDRLSAFDVVMAEPIPDKGRVLTALTVFWAELLADLAPTHLVSVVSSAEFGEDLVGRALVVERAEMLPLECIVRGYLSGSAWKEYRQTGTLHGEPAPAGLRESDRLPTPLFTPSTKATVGHDENISFATAVSLVGADTAAAARDLCLAAYDRGAKWAEERGVIIADTKFELGWINGELTICDEILTPDSSRFWPARRVGAGLGATGARQAARARLARGDGMGQAATAAGVDACGRLGDAGALHRSLRTPDRAVLPGLAGSLVTTFEVLVEVRLRPGIADPEGLTIERALPALGFSGISGVSVGKAFRLRVAASTAAEAADLATSLATRLLANPVIEDSTVTVSAA